MMMLSRHSSAAPISSRRRAAGPMLPASSGRLAAPRLTRCATIVAFKEPQQPDQPEPEPAPATPGAAKHANNAAARGREALDKLLRRREHGESAVNPAVHAELKGQATGPPPTTAAPRQQRQAPAFQAPLSRPLFSRRREVLVGRVAMAGFYSSCMMEAFLNGLGPVAQLSVLTGLPPVVVQALLAAFVVHGAWGLLPLTPTWSSGNRNDLLRRPVGPPRRLVNPVSNPAAFFGYSPSWGFTKANEVFAGRLAMLGFLGTVAAEPLAKGRGALGQIAYYMGLPAGPQYYQFSDAVLVVSSIVFGVLAYVNRQPGQLRGGDDIY